MSKYSDPKIPWRETTECPSETQLDGLVTGELSKRRAKRITNHLKTCLSCQNRRAIREAGFHSYAQLDPQALLSGIQAKISNTTVPNTVKQTLRELREKAENPSKRAIAFPKSQVSLWSFPRWAYGALGICAVALLGILFSFWHTESYKQEKQDIIRIKGGLRLQVVRERQGIVEKTYSGEIFYPGDKLRFVVDIPKEGELMVVGQEENHRLYMCYPAGDKTRSRPVMKGLDQTLPGAVVLDDSLGQEWLHLVLCPSAFEKTQIKEKPGPGHIEIPPGCLSTSFQIDKQSR